MDTVPSALSETPSQDVVDQLHAYVQLEDGADDSNPLDEDLEELLDNVRSLTNPWTSTEQQVSIPSRL